MSKKLKKSQYLMFIETEKKEIIIYHSVTGFLLLCNQKEYIERAKALNKSDEILYDEKDDFFNLLYEKGLLLELNFDEDIHIRQMYEENIMNQKQLMITLIVTRQCNFRCVYCGQKHENKKMKKSTYDSIMKFIKKMCQTKKYDSIVISFFGGEPLLEYDNIIYFLTLLNSYSKKTGIEFDAGMTTNAYLLTPEKFLELASLNCLSYQITLDGMSYSHDKKRFLIGGKPSWQRIVDNLEYIKSTDVKFNVSLRTNFDSTVLETVEEYLDFVSKKLKDERIQIYYETIKDHGNQNQTEYMGKVEAMLNNVEISKMLKEKGLKSSIVYHSTAPYCSMCRAGMPSFYVIDFDASIKKCTNRLDTNVNKIGYLTEDGDALIDNNLNSKWIYNDYLSNTKCKMCKLLPLCFGKKCPVEYVDDALVFECNQELKKVELEEIISAHI